MDKAALFQKLQDAELCQQPALAVARVVLQLLKGEGRGRGVRLSSAREHTLILAALGRHSLWRAALAVWTRARRSGLQLNIISSCALIDACGNGLNWNVAVALFGRATVSEGLVVDDAICNSVCGACNDAHQWVVSCVVLQGCRSQHVYPTAMLLNSKVSSFTPHEKWHVAANLLAEFRRSHVESDEGTYNGAMDASATSSAWQRSMDVLQQCLCNALQTSTIAFNTAMCSYARSVRWHRAFSAMCQARRLTCRIDVITCNTAISACGPAIASAWALVNGILESACASALQGNTVTVDTATNVLASSQKWAQGFALLRQAKQSWAPCTQAAYNAVLGTCNGALKIEWRRAGAIVLSMFGAGVRLDATSYNTVIDILGKHRAWESGPALFDQLRRAAVAPDVATSGTLVSSCSDGSRWESAMLLLSTGRRLGLQSDMMLTSAVLAAAARASLWELGLSPWRGEQGSSAGPDLCVTISACQRWDHALSLVASAMDQHADASIFAVGLLACEANMMGAPLNSPPYAQVLWLADTLLRYSALAIRRLTPMNGQTK